MVLDLSQACTLHIHAHTSDLPRHFYVTYLYTAAVNMPVKFPVLKLYSNIPFELQFVTTSLAEIE